MYVASSLSSLWNYYREGLSREGVMKRYALLYEKVIFNRRGIGIGKGELAENLGQAVSMLIHPGKTLPERKLYGSNKAFCDIFVDCWEFVEDASKFESSIFDVLDSQIHKRIGDFCHQELSIIHGGKTYDIDDAKDLYGDLAVDLGMNQLLNKEGVDLIPSYAPIIGRALSNEYQHQGVECHELFSNDFLIPSFDELTWDEIIDLRTDKNIESFRSVVFEVAQENPKSLDQALISKVHSDLWSLASEVKPNITGTLLTGFIGNLPSPILLNPVGVGAAIKDSYQAKKRIEKYGHVFFIQGIRGKRLNK